MVKTKIDINNQDVIDGSYFVAENTQSICYK